MDRPVELGGKKVKANGDRKSTQKSQLLPFVYGKCVFVFHNKGEKIYAQSHEILPDGELKEGSNASTEAETRREAIDSLKDQINDFFPNLCQNVGVANFENLTERLVRKEESVSDFIVQPEVASIDNKDTTIQERQNTIQDISEKSLERVYAELTGQQQLLEELLQKVCQLPEVITNQSSAGRSLLEKVIAQQKSFSDQNKEVSKEIGLLPARLEDRLKVHFGMCRDLIAGNSKMSDIERLEGLIQEGFMRVGALEGRIDNRIDLKDASQVLELRNEIERFVHSSLLYTMSKQIMPTMEILKSKIDEFCPAVSDIAADLDSRCIQAGLISTDNLF